MVMIAVPFIYFTSLCLYFVYKHGRFETSAWLAFLYAVSALAAIPVYFQNMVGIAYGMNIESIGVVPTILYCGLLTLTFLPFSQMNSEKIVRIEEGKPWLVYTVSWLFIATFFLTLFNYMVDLKDVFAVDDLKKVRDMVYSGDNETQLTGIRYYLALPETLFSALAMLAIPFFFYSLCCTDNSWWFNALLLLSSTTSIVKSILIAGRTQIIYWLFIFVACYLFFAHLLKPMYKHVIRIAFGILGSGVMLFFVAVTAARYYDMAELAYQMIMLYLGEAFVLFCYFWDNFTSDFISFQRLFPFVHKFLLGVDIDLELYRDRVFAQSGLFIGVFFTFLGDLLIDIGRLGMIIYVFIYHGVARLFLSREDESVLPFYQLLIWLLLLLVPLEGLFYYSFHTLRMSYYVLETILLIFLFKYRIRLWHKTEDEEALPESSESEEVV